MRIERVVRTNYNDLKNGVHATTEYLERFFENLLFNTNHDLKTAIYMLITSVTLKEQQIPLQSATIAL